MKLAALGPRAPCFEPCCGAPIVAAAIVCLRWPLEAQMSPNQCFRDIPRVMLSRWITSVNPKGHLQLAPIWHTQLLFLPLSVWFGLRRPLEASRGPNEPKSVFSGRPQSDIIVIDHFWICWTLPTCSNMPYTTFIPHIVWLV